MNNACKIEECKITEMEQPTFKDILAKLNKLELENKCLKADNKQLAKERDEWKEGFELLHNIMEEQNNDGSLLNEYENGEVEVDYDAYAKELSEKRIPKELEWKYEA